MKVIILSLILQLGGATRKVQEAIDKMPIHCEPPEVRVYNPPSHIISLPASLLEGRANITPQKTQYIIGDEPAETLRVTSAWEFYGDVYIINDGVMIVEDSGTAIIHGNIGMQNSANLIVNQGTLEFPQAFTYEWGIQVSDSALFKITNGRIRLGSKPFTIGVIQGRIEIDTLTLENGWITGTLFSGASLYASHVNSIGEWIYHDSSTAVISNVDTLLNWFTLDMGDTAFLELPTWDSIQHFVAERDSNGFYGVDYSVHLDSINLCMWGLLIDYGAYVDIQNSKLRTIGLYGTSVDTQNVSGLVDSTYYSDFTAGFTDRYLHISNTTVRTWSLYPSNAFNLNFTSSIVGEVLTMDYSTAWGDHYYLDGSGGHFQAAGNSFNVAMLSAMTSEVYTTENGVALLVVTAIPYGKIWSRNASRIYMIQCQFPEKPVSYDSGLVYIMNIDGPTEAPVNEMVPVFGTAYIVEGPLSSIHFDHYSLYFANREDTTTWFPIAENIMHEVYRDTLGYWNTTGLSEGDYVYRLKLFDTYAYGDSLSMDWGVTLGPSSVKEERHRKALLLYDAGKVRLNAPYDIKNGSLMLYDATGRLFKTLLSGHIHTGAYEFKIPEKSGIYIVRFEDKENGKTIYVRFEVLK